MNTLNLHGLLLCGLKNRPNDVVDIDSIKDIIVHVVEESPTNITFRMGDNLQIIPTRI